MTKRPTIRSGNTHSGSLGLLQTRWPFHHICRNLHITIHHRLLQLCRFCSRAMALTILICIRYPVSRSEDFPQRLKTTDSYPPSPDSIRGFYLSIYKLLIHFTQINMNKSVQYVIYVQCIYFKYYQKSIKNIFFICKMYINIRVVDMIVI